MVSRGDGHLQQPWWALRQPRDSPVAQHATACRQYWEIWSNKWWDTHTEICIYIYMHISLLYIIIIINIRQFFCHIHPRQSPSTICSSPRRCKTIIVNPCACHHGHLVNIHHHYLPSLAIMKTVLNHPQPSLVTIMTNNHYYPSTHSSPRCYCSKDCCGWLMAKDGNIHINHP